jgi:uncharacterized protein (TIGR02598 family)
MRKNRAFPVSPRTDRAGFTLTEIVLALAIIATAFIAVLGLLPAGLNQSREAANSTVVAAILEDLHNRLQGEIMKDGEASFSPAFFDDRGIFILPSADADDQARREQRRLYRAEVKIGTWKTQPANTSGLRPITIALSWPVNTNDKLGPALGSDNPKTVVSYGATGLTGTDWETIDGSYKPKIEY